MYMPGRVRTCSTSSSTLIMFSVYAPRILAAIFLASSAVGTEADWEAGAEPDCDRFLSAIHSLHCASRCVRIARFPLRLRHQNQPDMRMHNYLKIQPLILCRQGENVRFCTGLPTTKNVRKSSFFLKFFTSTFRRCHHRTCSLNSRFAL